MAQLKKDHRGTWYGPYWRSYKTGRDRRQVVLAKPDGKTTSMLYSRYLMQEHLGRDLEPHEHVDHIDDDCQNDVIENLQILSRSENGRKSAPKPAMLEAVCPQCSETFEVLARQYRGNQQKQGRKGPFCGRRCAGRWSAIQQYSKVGN